MSVKALLRAVLEFRAVCNKLWCPSIFHTVSDKNLTRGKAGYEATHYPGYAIRISLDRPQYYAIIPTPFDVNCSRSIMLVAMSELKIRIHNIKYTCAYPIDSQVQFNSVHF